jgi:hypothetical protein
MQTIRMGRKIDNQRGGQADNQEGDRQTVRSLYRQSIRRGGNIDSQRGRTGRHSGGEAI